MSAQIQTALTIIRRKQLEAKIGLGRSTIYARIDAKSKYYDPSFPRPIKLGAGSNPPIGWNAAEVDAWIEAQIKNSRPAA